MHSIIRSESITKVHNKETFLYITNNFSQAELAILSVLGSKNDFLIFINDNHKGYNFLTDYQIPGNVKITSDFKSVIMLAAIFSAVITTVGHISPVLNVKIISILKACISSEIPIIEVPHGLYQWGYNLVDDSKFVNTASNTLGAGYPVPSFADHQISWFDNTGIGYPRHRTEKIKCTENIMVPDYTVITTNTNWYMYGFEDQRVLAQSIFEYAKANPERMFIWCHHPAELNATNLINNMLGAKPANIFRYGHDKDIYFHSLDTTEEVIQYAQAGISTISTCLLDYELYNIPTAIFQTEGLSTIQNSMIQASFFSSQKELNSLKFEIPKTGHLQDYNVSNFDDRINELTRRKQYQNKAQRIILTL